MGVEVDPDCDCDGLPVELSFFVSCSLRCGPSEACRERGLNPKDDERESQGALCRES